MTLDVDEFIRRFLIHVLPDGFHRIRHYGLLANGNRAGNIALARRLLAVPDPPPSSEDNGGTENPHEDKWNACPCCGGRMIIIETFEPRLPASAMPYPIDRARQLMTITPLSPSPITASVQRRYLIGTGRTLPTATASAALGRQNLEHQRPNHRADRIHGGHNQRPVDQATVALSATHKSDQAAAANSP